MNQSKNYNSLCVSQLHLSSRDTFDIQDRINESVIGKPSYFKEKWQLLRVYNIDNKIFEKEYNDKRCDLQEKSNIFSQWEGRFGFLTTIKESMIHKVAEEGLEVRLCPYNYFGHSISGVHISQNADVCMNEALNKIGPDDEIILIVFKYMLGRHKLVPMYDPDILVAPTPKFDSHLCKDRPDPTEKISDQYIKSLVYLYEFENLNFDPTVRPRHCCPMSALVFKQARPYNFIDISDNEPVQSRISIYDEHPLSLLKPAPQPHWGREFILKPPLPNASMLIHKNERDDSRKVVVPTYANKGFELQRKPVNENTQRWEPIKYEFFEPDIEGGRNRSVRSRSQSRRDGIDSERDRSFERIDRDRIGPGNDGGLVHYGPTSSVGREDLRGHNNVSTYVGDNFVSGSTSLRNWLR